MTVGELAAMLGGICVGNDSLQLVGIAPLSAARPDEVSYLTRADYVAAALESAAGCVIVSDPSTLPNRTLIVVPNARLAYLGTIDIFNPPPAPPPPHLSSLAHIEPSAVLGVGVSVGPFATIGARTIIGDHSKIGAGTRIGSDCRVGTNCQIYSGAVLYDGSSLADRVIVHANAVIGSDGFGFYLGSDEPVRIPQVGKVVIESDVEIGPSSCIERATLTETYIGPRAKIGALVIVGHNTYVGQDTVIVAHSAIAGSVRIGRAARIWGKVGVRGHRTIGNNAKVLAASFVTSDVPDGTTVGGNPAVAHIQWKRGIVALSKLPAALRQLGRLSSSARLNKEGATSSEAQTSGSGSLDKRDDP